MRLTAQTAPSTQDASSSTDTSFDQLLSGMVGTPQQPQAQQTHKHHHHHAQATDALAALSSASAFDPSMVQSA